MEISFHSCLFFIKNPANKPINNITGTAKGLAEKDFKEEIEYGND